MKRSASIATFMQHTWHIEPMRARALVPVVLSILQGKLNPESFSKIVLPFLVKRDGTSIIASTEPGNEDTVEAIQLPEPTEEGLIAVIPIQGVLMKYGYWYQPGMKDIAQWFNTAMKSDNVDAVIFYTDSPGGSTDGVQELVDTIALRTKPLVGFIDGCGASAAYEILCTGDEVIAMNQTCFAGSIGTMFSSLDLIPLLEKFGAKSYEEYADASTQKNIEWRELEKGNAKPLKANMLNPLNDIFKNNVQRFRGDKVKNDVLSGSCMLAQLALENGLIDSIGSFEYAVQRARALSAEKKSTSTSKPNSTMKKFIVASFPILAAFLGMTQDGDFTEAHLKQVEGELATHNALKTERDSINAKLQKANGDLLSAQTSNADLTQKLTDANASAKAWETVAKSFGAKDAEPVKEIAANADLVAAPTAEADAKAINDPFDAELDKLGM